MLAVGKRVAGWSATLTSIRTPPYPPLRRPPRLGPGESEKLSRRAFRPTKIPAFFDFSGRFRGLIQSLIAVNSRSNLYGPCRVAGGGPRQVWRALARHGALGDARPPPFAS